MTTHAARPSATTTPRRLLLIGVVGMVLMVLGSYGGGAVRFRGGPLHDLGLGFFAYGHGGSISTTVLWCGVAIYLITWSVLGRVLLKSTPPGGSAHSARALFTTRAMLTLLGVWAAVLSVSGPLFSRDAYSYLVQGAMVRDGFDPYTQGPIVNPNPLLFEVSADWRGTTTPYGPLHLLIMRLITEVTDNSVTAGLMLLSVVTFIAFMLLALAVAEVAHLLGTRTDIALWLGMMNPVVLFHLVGGAHNEVLMLAFAVGGVVMLLRRRPVTGLVLIGLGIAVKFTAAIMVPFAVWILLRHRVAASAPLRQQAPWFVAYGALSVLVSSVTVIAVSLGSGAGFGWVTEMMGNSKIINWLALPTALAHLITGVGYLVNADITFIEVVAITRSICLVILLVLLVVLWWLFRHSARQAVSGIVVCIAAFVMFNAVALPWYHTAGLVLAGAGFGRRRILLTGAALSIWLSLMFAGSGNNNLYNGVWVVAALLITAAATWAIAGWPRPTVVYRRYQQLTAAEAEAQPATA